MRYILLGLFTVGAAVLTGRGSDEARVYDATASLATTQGGGQGDFQFSGNIRVNLRSSEEISDVAVSGQSTIQKGPRNWIIETRSSSGQDVSVDHDDSLKTMVMTVSGRKTAIRLRDDGFWEHDGMDFKNTPEGRAELATAAANRLKSFRIQDDSVVANFGSRMWAFEQTHVKFFFTDVYVDVDTQITANLGVNIGAFNSNTF